MENKFIRVNTPLYLIATAVFDLAALAFCIIAVYNVAKERTFMNIVFMLICLTVQVVMCIVTLTVAKKGAKFTADRVEFTWLDDNNIFSYEEIEKVEIHRDTEASLKKNLVDRYTSIILYLKDGTVATVEVGLTGKRTIQKIEDEIKKRTA